MGVTPAEPTSQPDRTTMSAQKMLTVLLFFVFLSSLSFSAEASAIHEEKRFDYDYHNPYAIQYKRSFDDYSLQQKSGSICLPFGFSCSTKGIKCCNKNVECRCNLFNTNCKGQRGGLFG